MDSGNIQIMRSYESDKATTLQKKRLLCLGLTNANRLSTQENKTDKPEKEFVQ